MIFARPVVRAVVILLLAGALAACAAPEGPRTGISRMDFPPMDRVETAAVGERVAEFRRVKEVEGIRFTSTYEAAPGPHEPGRFRVRAGETFVLVRDRGHGTTSIYAGFAEDLRENGIRRPVTLGLMSGGLAILGATEADGEIELAQVDPGMFETVMVPVRDAANKRRVLVYLGRFGSQIGLLYLEFVGDMSTPRVRDELSFDLAAGPVIEVLGIRFEILQADGRQVRFRRLPSAGAPEDRPFEQAT